MLKIIKHRINTRSQLAKVDSRFGCEIDLRSNVAQPGALHLAHEPWVQGENFEDWILDYAKRNLAGPLILNTKEDGLENRAVELCQQAGVRNIFFLDTAFPTLVRHTQKENKTHFAIRLSKYEKEDTLTLFIGKAEWLWVDCFDGTPLEGDKLDQWKDKFKICLVSPELQGQSPQKINDFKGLIPFAQAVCTKQPEQWENIL